MTRIPLYLALLVLAASPAAAQSGHIFGTVRDPSGAVLPAVSMRAVMRDTNGETTRRVVTDGSGWYDITEMGAGEWTVTASLPGFANVERQVKLAAGQGTEWSPELRVGSLQETLVVTVGAQAKRTEAQRPPAPPVPPAPADASVQTPVRVGGNIKPPMKIVNVSPAYPADAAAQRVGGVVILEATIGANGLVTNVRTLRSVHPSLDAAAADALKQWEFTPTLLNGQPVPVVMTTTIQFALD